jgi:hypothetical protein
MGKILGFLGLDKKGRQFKKFSKSLKASAEKKLERLHLDEKNLFGTVTSGIRGRIIMASKSNQDIAPQIVNLAQTILNFPPDIGAYLSTLVFGRFLIQNEIPLWAQGELMLTYEIMDQIDSNKVDKTAELIANALFMMDSFSKAQDTYLHMLTSKMQELVREKLRLVNREIAELIIRR